VGLRIVHWPDAATLAADVVVWGVLHAGAGYLVHRLPVQALDHDGWLWRPRPAERDGQVYERLGIRRWKDRLPEAGALFDGGISKRHLACSGSLERFVVETRRAELGHWLAMLPGPLFALWNPPGVAAVMVAYGIGVNLPFVAIQRYNRLRSSRVLARRAARAGAPRSTPSPGADAARARSACGSSGSSIP
jgi:glycosyl-4,4'-diaponeurosporenoate acyltransferase